MGQTASQWKLHSTRSSGSALRDDGEGRDGRKVQEGGDACVYTSHFHCAAENNTTLENNDIPILKSNQSMAT